ncbi:tryptase gamma-like [Pollicipes pollicipes]|uniref:tryptase gamma-like n=1 Tax=Pollicipes pollicipes TaxID=41117 RepID=UPI0018853CAA|nr:tryptase gamma-like [Pollicipes pollicipes]
MVLVVVSRTWELVVPASLSALSYRSLAWLRGGRRALRCGAAHVCCPRTAVYTPKCGRLKGNQAGSSLAGSAPWAAALLLKQPTGHVFVCGGALIHRQVVLTSARCVVGLGGQRALLVVRLGNGALANSSQSFQELQVGKVVVHQKFRWKQGTHDVALLFLNSSATLRPGLDTICTWVPRPSCQRALSSSTYSPFLAPASGLICTDPDLPCRGGRGRAGSPLTCADLRSGEHRLVGVAVWGEACPRRLRYGIYTRVQPLYRWIDFHVTDHFRYFESYFGFVQA